MAKVWVGRWAGGRIAARRDGTQVFYLERMVRGRRITVALDVAGKAAEGELALFNRDPTAWLKAQTEPVNPSAGARLDATSAEQFLQHLARTRRTLEYRRDVHRYLGEWAGWFAGRGIAEVTTAQLSQALRDWDTARGLRTGALKSFCSFLRDELHVLRRADDPTIDLLMPTARPEKTVRPKGHDRAHVELIYRLIASQHVRDVILLRAHTGMHEREVARLARGQGEVRLVRTPSEIAGVICFPHKRGADHLQSVPAAVLAAALRLVNSGLRVTLSNVRRRLVVAAAHASRILGYEVPRVRAGELRHSFVTWAREAGRVVKLDDAGVALEIVAETIGHDSRRTTRRWYDGVRVPPMIVVPIRLEHPQDPPITPVGGTPQNQPAPAASAGPDAPATPRARPRPAARAGAPTPP